VAVRARAVVGRSDLGGSVFSWGLGSGKELEVSEAGPSQECATPVPLHPLWLRERGGLHRVSGTLKVQFQSSGEDRPAH
jgi:hypothetical protein